jgi:hypothetical protein
MFRDMISAHADPVVGLDDRKAIFIKRLQGRAAAIDMIENPDIERHCASPLLFRMAPWQANFRGFRTQVNPNKPG